MPPDGTPRRGVMWLEVSLALAELLDLVGLHQEIDVQGGPTATDS